MDLKLLKMSFMDGPFELHMSYVNGPQLYLLFQYFVVCVPTFTKSDRQAKASIGSGHLVPRIIKVRAQYRHCLYNP